VLSTPTLVVETVPATGAKTAHAVDPRIWSASALTAPKGLGAKHAASASPNMSQEEMPMPPCTTPMDRLMLVCSKSTPSIGLPAVEERLHAAPVRISPALRRSTSGAAAPGSFGPPVGNVAAVHPRRSRCILTPSKSSLAWVSTSMRWSMKT